jgi:hypothetical protein
MHRIYRQASRVWIWLGCATGHSQAAIALLPRIAQVGRVMDQNPLPRWATHPTPESMGLPDAASSVWAPVREIL